MEKKESREIENYKFSRKFAKFQVLHINDKKINKKIKKIQKNYWQKYKYSVKS